MAEQLSDSDLHAMRDAGCVAAGCTDPAWRDRRLHAPNCTQPDIDWLLAEVRRLRAGIARHRDEGHELIGHLTHPADERLWALLVEEDSDG
jgi:hypothetical protein